MEKSEIRKRKEKAPDKRKGYDLLTKIFFLSIFLSWCLFIATILMLGQASPQFEIFTDRALGQHVRTYWDIRMVQTVKKLLLAVFFLSLSGVVLNIMRLRRKTDRISLTHILMLIVSLAIFFYLNYRF